MATITGTIGNDSLTGSASSIEWDEFIGSIGDDTLDGGVGLDHMYFDTVTGPLTADFVAGTVTGVGVNTRFYNMEGFTGSSAADTVIGSDADEVIEGGGGDDSLSGGGGVDILDYASASGGVSVDLDANLVSGADGADIISGFEGVAGSNFDDTLSGNDGDNWINGGKGSDNLSGGLGFDTLSYGWDHDFGVSVNLATGVVSGIDAGADTISGFEAIVGTEFNDTLTGDGGDNIIEGGLGDDSLDGGLGEDTLGFGDGVYGDGVSDEGVNANLATGVVTGVAGSDTVSGFEHIIGSDLRDSLTGDGNDNLLDGGLGDDEFYVSLGNDTVVGGDTGDDGDALFFVNIAEGVKVDFTTGLASDLATGSGFTTEFSQIDGAIGTAFADSMLGSDADETMAGGLGDDTLIGGGGVDMLFYGFSIYAVTVNLATNLVSGLDGADSISGFEQVVGSSGNDTLTGTDGDNLIDGGAGDDLLAGGDGFDTLGFDHGPSNLEGGVNVNLETGVVTGGAGTDTISGFEAVESTDNNDQLTGNTGANLFIIVGGGTDVIAGGGGFDTVSYALSHGGPSGVNADLGTGSVSGSHSATLSGISGVIGSDFNDTLTGASGSSKLEGGKGKDSLTGQGGNDTLLGGDGADSINGGGGGDHIFGGLGNEAFIIGGSGYDTLDYGGYLPNSVGYIIEYTFQGSNGYASVKVSGNGSSYFEQDYSVIEIEQINGTAHNDQMFDLGVDRSLGFNPGRGNDLVVGSPVDGFDSDAIYYNDITDPNIRLVIDLDTGALNNFTHLGFSGNAALYNGATLIEVDRVLSITDIFGTAGSDDIKGANAIRFEFFRPGAGNDTVDGRGGTDIVDYGSAARGVNITLAASGTTTTVLDDGYGGVGFGGIDTLLNIEMIYGSGHADTLTGNASDNRLRGRGGNDTLDGGAGFDLADYRSAGSAVNITLAASGDTIVNDGQGGTDTIRNFEALRGSEFNDVLGGNASANRLQGLYGDDTLLGGGGNDSLDGQSGFDVATYGYLTHASGYVISFNNNNGTVVVTGVGANSAYTETDTISSVEVLQGSALNDSISDGQSGRNMYLMGGTGNDTINGNTLDYDFAVYHERDAFHVVTANLGTGVVIVTKTNDGGYSETDSLSNIRGIWGGAGADSFTGGTADEYFRGFAGDDTIDGGAGMDIADFRSGTSVNISLSTEGFTVVSDGQDGTDTLSNIEGLSGTLGNDTLVGNFEDNWLRGRSGNDSIDGSSGHDTLSHSTASSAVDANLITGVVRDGEGGTDTVSNIEHLQGGDYNDTLFGNSSGNRLEGRNGDDTLQGGVGSDTLDGGSGFDYADYTYLTDSNGYNFVLSSSAMAVSGKGGNSGYAETDQVASIDAWYASNGADGMTDQVAGRQSYLQGRGGNDTLTGNVQDTDFAVYWERGSTISVNANLATGSAVITDSANLAYTETDLLSGINGVMGSWGADTLVGNSYNNYLRGDRGSDSIDGGDGFDTVSFSRAQQGIVVNMAAAGVAFTVDDGFGTDTLNNVEGIDGSNYDDRITGNSSDNILRGRNGFDRLDGGAGLDAADYASSEYAVNITLAATGNTTVLDDGYGASDLLISIEGIYGSGYNDTLIGNSAANLFSGRFGNDTIDGLGGTDSVSFTHASAVLNFTLAAAGVDTVVNEGGGGLDTLRNIESIRASNFNDNVTGNVLANQLWGNQGNDTLSGADGADSLLGEDGDDVLDGGAGNDSISGGKGFDVLTGGSGNDTLDGGLMTDLVFGLDENRVSYSADVGGVNVNLQTGVGIDGSGGIDTLLNFAYIQGSAFNDTLTGRTGAWDSIEGGAGNDMLDGGAITDLLNATDGNRVSFQNATALVTVDLLAGTAVGTATGNDTLANFLQLRGSSYNDSLYGSNRTDFSEHFEGRNGNDYVDGRGGFDLVRFVSAGSAVTASLVDGTATGGAGTDTFLNIEGLIGSGFGDSLTGGNAANGVVWSDGLLEVFRGEAGNDTLDGGQGYDRADYTSSTSAVNVTLNDTQDGSAQDGFGGTDTLRNIEAVRGSYFNDTLRGSDTAEFEQFEGREGNDSIDGKGGVDRVDYRFSTSGVVVDLGAGTASDGYGGNDTLVGIEQVRGSRDFDDSLTGSTGNNRLEGMGGNDTLNGGAGDDRYAYAPGSDGNDLIEDSDGAADVLVIIDNPEAQDTFPDFTKDGDDLLISVFNTALGTANGSVRVKDHYLGGTVESFEIYNNANELQVSLALATGLTGSEFGDLISGGVGEDSLVGDAGDDWLFGAAGNDTLDGGLDDDRLAGGGGNDSLLGGEGNDSYQWNPALSGNDVINDSGGTADALVVESSGYVFDAAQLGNNLKFTAYLDGVVASSVTIIDHFGDGITTGLGELEELVLGPPGFETTYTFVEGVIGGDADEWMIGTAGADTFSGGGGADQLFAGAGDDILDGGDGEDVMSGGDGGDTYVVDSSDDLVVEYSDNPADIDTVLASASFVLSNNVERLELVGDDSIDGTGNNQDNELLGNVGDNELDGGGGADLIDGGLGDDVLDGGTGADVMDGGSGSDTYYVDDVEDVVAEDNNLPPPGLPLGLGFPDYELFNDIVNSTVSYELTANLENLVLAGLGNTTATGNALRNELVGNVGNNQLLGLGDIDTLSGGLGNDTLDGGAGSDSMVGGDGNDTYLVDATTDSVVEANAAATGGIDLVQSFVAGTIILSSNVENGRVMIAGASNLTGNSGANTLFAGAGNNLLSGGGGSDTASYLYATAAVTVSLALATAQATGGSGSDTFASIENLTGSAYKDRLTGNASANVLDGGSNADTMIGGAGDDQYLVNSATDLVTELAGEGTDTILSTVTYSLADTDGAGANGGNVENLRLTGTGAINATGNAVANTLYAGNGNNVLTGDGGSDTVSYLYATAAVTASLALATAQATGGSGSDTFATIENLTGSAFNDTLTGSAGANVLDGGAGSDRMVGGNGSDIYLVRQSTDIVVETDAAAAGGIDLVQSYVSGTVTLTANVENGRVMAAGASHLTGNSVANTLFAGAGSNVLTGGGGVDTVSYLYAAAGVTASLALATAQATGGSGSDTFATLENLTGSAFNDTLTGSTGANVLDGGAGIDNMKGGDGNDTYHVRNVGDLATETNAAAAGGTDTVLSYLATYTLLTNVEKGVIAVATAANLTGNSLANTLTGGAGANVLDGGTGVDTMIGGDGDDTYLVRQTGETITEASSLGSGIDLAKSYLASYTLAANVENGQVMLATAASLTGNGLANTLFAGAGANTLNGGTGIDTASYLNATAGVTVSLALTTAQATGGSGSDTLAAMENLAGSNFNDKLTGSTVANMLSGGAGADSLIGGGGADTLDGGAGKDSLTGGSGADHFDFNLASESGILSTTWDRINDFKASDLDKIDLSGIDANQALANDQAFTNLLSSATAFSATSFTGASAGPGKLYFDSTAHVLYGNTDSDTAAEFAIELVGVNILVISDIVV